MLLISLSKVEVFLFFFASPVRETIGQMRMRIILILVVIELHVVACYAWMTPLSLYGKVLLQIPSL